MKKTVLYLMNGFGVEQKDSYNIFNSNLMPNLERFTNEYLFGTISSPELDLYNSYRTFSTSSKHALTYPFLDEYSLKFDANPHMKNMFEQLPEDYTIQLFVTIKYAKTFEHLKNFVDYVNSKKKNPINLHILLDSKNVLDYKEIDKVITKLNYGLKELPLKTISGINILKDKAKTYIQILNNGVGEKWRELEKKFTSLEASNIAPENVEPFYFDNKFEFNEKSCIFFFNYVPFDMEKLTEGLNTYNKIDKTFSLFPMQGVSFPMFSYPTSNICMTNSIKKLGFKALMISPENQIRRTNYFCTGLREISDDYLIHSILDENNLTSKEYLKTVCTDDRFELTIINDSIESITTIDEILEKLKKIDMTIKLLEEVSEEEGVTLVISSMYGFKREVKSDNFSKFLINFSGKVPVIIKDKVFTKSTHAIEHLDLYALANTVYTNINSSNTGEVLIKKKNQLLKMTKK